MGCKQSKSKKSAYARVAQYQKESWAAEKAVRNPPLPLDWGTSPLGCINPASLHNLLTDGFYSPYAANPLYLLLVDCRDFGSFTRRHVFTATWQGALTNKPRAEKYYYIVLYDERPRSSVPSPDEDSYLAKLYRHYKSRSLNPLVVTGGWGAISNICEHLTVTDNGTPSVIPWYPVLVLPGFLYLGQFEMASNPRILTSLKITHVVALSHSVPKRVLPSTNYLVVPLSVDDSGDPNEENTTKIGTTLTSCCPTLMDFVLEAKGMGGSVLVYCDQGISRAAAIVIILLMKERWCSLEDAYYYVKGARGMAHPHPKLLEELLSIEESQFGTSLTSIDDLF